MCSSSPLVVIRIVLLSFCDVHVEVCGHTHNWFFLMSTRILFYNLCNDKAALNVHVLHTVLTHSQHICLRSYIRSTLARLLQILKIVIVCAN